MLNRVLGLTFANLSTLILAVAVLVLPLHLVYSFAFRNVIEVHEVHDQIAGFPESRQVRGVGRDQLERYRAGGWILLALEAVSIPVLLRVTRRVLDDAESGELPTALGAWRGLRSAGGATRPAPGPVLMAALIGALAWLPAAAMGGILVEMAGPAFAWVAAGLTRGLALCLALVFPLVAAVTTARPPSSSARETADNAV